MTPYQVIWSREALRQLAALWNASVPIRNDITRASHRIDVALARDPKSAGRELSEGLWRIDDSPLVAFYEINDFHRILRVTDVYVI
jgi:hypothetical protein